MFCNSRYSAGGVAIYVSEVVLGDQICWEALQWGRLATESLLKTCRAGNKAERLLARSVYRLSVGFQSILLP